LKSKTKLHANAETVLRAGAVYNLHKTIAKNLF